MCEMKVIILVGGLGMRIRSLLTGSPKPMAKFKKRPFLEYQIIQLRDQGFTEIVLCSGYLADHIQNYFGSGASLGVKVHHVVEEKLLGTAGAIRNARKFIQDRFLVLNGDSFLDIDFRQLLDFHSARYNEEQRTIATIVSVAIQDVGAYGSLQIDEKGIIHNFAEKGAAGLGWINGGVYVFEKEILEHIPANKSVSLEKTTFPLLLNSGKRLYSYPFDGFFVDIGTPAGHQCFGRFVENGMVVNADM